MQNILQKVNNVVPLSKIANVISQGIKGPGGIRTETLKDIGSTAAGNIIGMTGLSKENKDALTGIKDQLVDRIKTPASQTIGSLISKPTVQAPSAKPDSAPAAKKWTFDKLGWWDRAKNWMGGSGNEDRGQQAFLGLKTHQITDQDYIVNPKTGKSEFSWDQARKNDAERGRATKTEFDPSALIGLAAKFIK